ncbi:MAG: hypothetical protein IKR85_11510 [Clostridia bacterium]|nr:hypothetical protein [Clostridia bacterium]
MEMTAIIVFPPNYCFFRRALRIRAGPDGNAAEIRAREKSSFSDAKIIITKNALSGKAFKCKIFVMKAFFVSIRASQALPPNVYGL